MAGARKTAGKTAFLFSCVLSGLLLESRRELRKVKLTEYTIPIAGLPREAEGKKLLFFSDYHEAEKGKNNSAIRQLIHSFAPDAVLVGGDMLNGGSGAEDMSPAIDLLNTLADEFPVYMALGNHEKKILSGCFDDGSMWKAFIERLSPEIKLLMNEDILLPGFGNLRLYGLDMDRKYYRKKNLQKLSVEEMRRALPKKEGVSIVLAHDPEQFPAYAGWGGDLILSGHYHGGMIRLPILGGVISPRFRLFPYYDYGLYEQGRTRMLVTNGLGQHTIKLRFGNIPEVVGIILTGEQHG